MSFLRRLFGRRVAAQGMTSSDVLRIVSAYGAVLSQTRSSGTQTLQLPYPKPIIKQALISAIGLAQQPTMRDELRAAYVRLAAWPEGLHDPAEASALAQELETLGLQRETHGE